MIPIGQLGQVGRGGLDLPQGTGFSAAEGSSFPSSRACDPHKTWLRRLHVLSLMRCCRHLEILKKV